MATRGSRGHVPQFYNSSTGGGSLGGADFRRALRRNQMTSQANNATGTRKGPNTMMIQMTALTRPFRIEVSTPPASLSVSPGRQATGVGVGVGVGVAVGVGVGRSGLNWTEMVE